MTLWIIIYVRNLRFATLSVILNLQIFIKKWASSRCWTAVVCSPRRLVSFMLFHNFENVSKRLQIDDIASSVLFSRNNMLELEFVPNHVSSINITLVTPVELSYDFCGFSNSGLMFFDYINYCHLITVGSFVLLIQIY